jgi:hypothetical protein
VDVLGHDDERVELKSRFTTVSVESLQEKTNVVLDNKKATSLPGRECNEIRAGWRDEASGLQEQTSAAKAAIFA